MNIQENFSLKNHNTFRVETLAKYFVEVNSIDELKQVLQLSGSLSFPLLLLGGGSNVLLTKDYDGWVIKLNLKGKKEEILDENHVIVTAKAGENWHEFVLYTLAKNYGGLENLSLIQ